MGLLLGVETLTRVDELDHDLGAGGLALDGAARHQASAPLARLEGVGDEVQQGPTELAGIREHDAATPLANHLHGFVLRPGG